ncbi:hypothetical protein SAICODRAFT_10347 [Saitoella complicata NRRL Y-17804]|uniref:Uncharacterized protein n=1 Tax=Saitoella complicata (strain BCRC 22490 / CBS 7301 / JCM 7358 / NBRC 10748 / NRRL Y-17804) TaxID=698492 RepID=A0A0E9NK17_SAICN|nr:uncharacterized protein SAICODRAFT_10347 [Saitoella complicata NRRL Y-17804]ODQ50058.1 hypothetical protein SAICODRAFT_10347 [Saitoella complicata NRRL Y-17804]GAO49745.1 hypothetical protein G7K_3888-t1 [Saitoella complicata NRRL Y-17804]
MSSPPPSSSPSSSIRTNRRKGYIKPQETPFANSARSRSSVMALGSIQHLQHFFAKSTRIFRGTYKPQKSSSLASTPDRGRDSAYASLIGSSDIMSSPTCYASYDDVQEEYEDENEESNAESDDEVPLPPEEKRVEHPPPLAAELAPGRFRQDLIHALDLCKSAWFPSSPPTATAENTEEAENEVEESEDMGLVRLAISAIRAARTYSRHSTSPFPGIDKPSLDTLAVLQGIAVRDANPPINSVERESVKTWIEGIEARLATESVSLGALPSREDFDDIRHWYKAVILHFLPQGLPPIPPQCLGGGISYAMFDYGDVRQTFDPLLAALVTGLPLIHAHNTATTLSSRPFGLITRYHPIPDLPYRRSENLTYWSKALEERWGVPMMHGGWKIEKVIKAGEEDRGKGERMLWMKIGMWVEAVVEEFTRPTTD